MAVILALSLLRFYTDLDSYSDVRLWRLEAQKIWEKSEMCRRGKGRRVVLLLRPSA